MYQTNKEYRDKILSGFKKYNESRKIKVAKIDENGNILQVYDCLSDAVREFNKGPSYTSAILRYADKFNKNGKRAKFLGCYWTIKNLESVSTIPVVGKYNWRWVTVGRGGQYIYTEKIVRSILKNVDNRVQQI